jgi:hypothetical protein
MEQQMTREKPKAGSGFSDKLGLIPPEYFDNDFAVEKPIKSKADLSPDQRRVLADNPSLSEDEALAQLVDAWL